MRIYNGRCEHRPIGAMEILRTEGVLGDVLHGNKYQRFNRCEYGKENCSPSIGINDRGNKTGF